MSQPEQGFSVKRLKLLLPDSSHPASYQPTPLGLNRYGVLAVYLYISILTSHVYFGWSSMSSLLSNAGFFSWLCSVDEGSSCIAQTVAIQNMFTVCYAAHFVCSAVAGHLLDSAGPKVTALIGQMMLLCGWGLLGACGGDFRPVTPVFLLIGAGSGTSYLPLLCVANLFPGSMGFCITLLGAAASGSIGVASVMHSVQMKGVGLHYIAWVYVLLGPVLCSALIIVFIPLEGFISADMYVMVPQATSRTSPNIKRLTSGVRDSHSSTLRRINLHATETLNTVQKSSKGAQLSGVTDEDYFKPFWSVALSFPYIGFCVYFIVCSAAVNFYQQAAPIILTPAGFRSLTVATPLSVIPCIILGRISDFAPMVPVLAFINTCGVLAYLLPASSQIYELHVASVVFFSWYISILSSQVSIFLARVLPFVHFGKLVGTAKMLGGFFALVSTALYDEVTIGTLAGNPRAVLWGFVVTLCLLYPLLFTMFVYLRKKREADAAHLALRMQGIRAASFDSSSFGNPEPRDSVADCSIPRTGPAEDQLECGAAA